MDILTGFKTLYAMLDGDISDLSGIEDTKIANMQNVLYGDGLGTQLPQVVVDNIEDMQDKVDAWKEAEEQTDELGNGQ